MVAGQILDSKFDIVSPGSKSMLGARGKQFVAAFIGESIQRAGRELSRDSEFVMKV